MRGRCNSRSHPNFKDYGGRGITICKRWDDYLCFLADMGEMPKGLTLERIDNDQGYYPENCRWATRKEQSNNRRDNPRYELNGQLLTVMELSAATGLSYSTIKSRLRRDGWSLGEALSTPPRPGARRDLHR